jgi:transcriptional regulator with XRE-family HTH domain
MDKRHETLGEYLRAARTEAHLSLREMERLTGISFGYLRKLETNDHDNPSADKLQRIADVLELDASELLAFIGITPSSVLPAADVFFRSKYGLSEAEAKEAAELIEQRYGKEKKRETDNEP